MYTNKLAHSVTDRLRDNISIYSMNMSIQIVKKNEASRCFELSTAELEVILSKPDVKDREIVVISIAGAFRKGKSFILNFFLKYLNEKVRNNNKQINSHSDRKPSCNFSSRENQLESNGWTMMTNVWKDLNGNLDQGQ